MCQCIIPAANPEGHCACRAKSTEVQKIQQVDAAIIGGGIAGLWLHHALLAQGYSSILIEKQQLGSGQTLASQGMIHGGIKYTLGGARTRASEAIAAMPDRWRLCLGGDDPVDLRGVATLAKDYYMFSDGSITAKTAAFFGSRALRGRVQRVPKEQYPEAFAHDGFKGSLYRLNDLVLDTASLVTHLAGCGHLVRGEPQISHERGKISGLTLGHTRLEAATCILAAGAGNGPLIRALGLPVTMQLRPLHQVIVKGGDLPELYGHAVSLRAGGKPVVTFTSHRTAAGNIWYLGGLLAETGVHRSEHEQIDYARRELAGLLPWINTSACTFSSFRVDRAEVGQAEGLRPDYPFARRYGNVVVCWPTKLTLAPMLGDMVLKLMPAPVHPQPCLPDTLASAPTGRAPWA